MFPLNRFELVLGAVLLLTVAGACVSKGDTNVGNKPIAETKRGSLCAQYCEKIEKTGCNLNPNCEANCSESASLCEDSGSNVVDIYLECAISEPMSCGASGSPSSPTCSDEWEPAAACAFGMQCVQAGEACSASADCCEGSTCVDIPEFGGGVCTSLCTQASDCQSGCCATIVQSSEGACAPTSYCELAVGDACGSNEECLSGYCENFSGAEPPGYCSTDCAKDADCGASAGGAPNKCAGGTCTAGCAADSDCEFFGDGSWICGSFEEATDVCIPDLGS